MLCIFSPKVFDCQRFNYTPTKCVLDSVPDEPLVFVHVALVKKLADSMNYIKVDTEAMADESEAKAAIFYSISSTQPGLQVSFHDNTYNLAPQI